MLCENGVGAVVVVAVVVVVVVVVAAVAVVVIVVAVVGGGGGSFIARSLFCDIDSCSLCDHYVIMSSHSRLAWQSFELPTARRRRHRLSLIRREVMTGCSALALRSMVKLPIRVQKA